MPMCLVGQSTTVSGTLTDPLGNVWFGATIQALFTNAPGIPGPYTWTGGAFNPVQATVTADSSGHFSMSLPTNVGFIAPSGSTWVFNVCPNSSLPCAVVNVALTGGTLDMESTITSQGAWPAGPIPVTSISTAYNSNQMFTPPARQGGLFYNNTTNCINAWNGTAWVAICTGGGGGNCPGSTANGQFLMSNGTDCIAAPADYQITNPQTITYSPVSLNIDSPKITILSVGGRNAYVDPVPLTAITNAFGIGATVITGDFSTVGGASNGLAGLGLFVTGFTATQGSLLCNNNDSGFEEYFIVSSTATEIHTTHSDFSCPSETGASATGLIAADLGIGGLAGSGAAPNVASLVANRFINIFTGYTGSGSDNERINIDTSGVMRINGNAEVSLSTSGQGFFNSDAGAYVGSADAGINIEGTVSYTPWYITHADSPYAIGNTQELYDFYDAVSGNIIANLPSLTAGINSDNLPGTQGTIYYLKKIDSSGNTVTINTFSGDTFEDGTTSQTLTAQNQYIILVAGACISSGCASSPRINVWSIFSNGGTGAVSSVFGRTGAVVANTGDYTCSQITGALCTGSFTQTDVTGSRVFNAGTTTYQNTTGGPIFVSATGGISGGSGDSMLTCLNGPSSATLAVGSTSTQGTITNEHVLITCWVPDTYFYEVVSTNIISTTPVKWYEYSGFGGGGGGSGITALTGDGTASGTGSVPLTLATVNSSPGTYGDATHVAQVAVNGKGLSTAVSSVAITFPTTATTQTCTDSSTLIATDAFVQCNKSILLGVTTSLAGSSLTAGSTESVCGTVTGAVTGSPVVVSSSDGTLQPVGILELGRVTSSNNLCVYRQNVTASTITTASKTYNFSVQQ